jgi:hypothetical protein
MSDGRSFPAKVVMLALYGVVVAVLWVLLLPLRMYMRATHQGNYARADR